MTKVLVLKGRRFVSELDLDRALGFGMDFVTFTGVGHFKALIFSDRMGGDMMQRTKKEDRRLFRLGYNREARPWETCTGPRSSVWDGVCSFGRGMIPCSAVDGCPRSRAWLDMLQLGARTE